MIDSKADIWHSTLAEMAPYTSQPKASPAGGVGKRGFLRLGFEQSDTGRTILRDWERRVPLIVQQELYFDEQLPDMACVYILSSGGPNVDGDRYEQIFTLRRGAMVHLATGAATLLASMRYNYSALRQRIRLEADAYLEYLPEPIIPCRHTRYASETLITIDPSATMVYGEIYFSGRRYFDCGERFQYDVLSVALQAEREDGSPLFREKFLIRPSHHSPEGIGAMGGYDIFANVVLLAPEPIAEAIYSATNAFVDCERQIAAGITRLPSACGVQYKIIGNDSGTIKRMVRAFASQVRQAVKGCRLDSDFPWR